MTEQYTVKDITRDLRAIMPLTRMFSVDADGFWTTVDDNKEFVYKLDKEDPGRKIVLFQDPMPKGDFYYFNPYAEGLGNTPPAVQYYRRVTRIALNLSLGEAITRTAQVLLDDKAARKDPSTDPATLNVDMLIVKLGAIKIDKKQTIYDALDEEAIKEIKQLLTRCDNELLNVTYLKQMATTKVTCTPFSDVDWETKYAKDLRKKSVVLFKALLLGILDVTKPEDIAQFTTKYDPTQKTAAAFYTTLSSYYKIYSQFNELLGILGLDQVNLGDILGVLDRSSSAYAIAKHMIQPTAPKAAPTSLATTDTSRFGSPVPGRRFSGPETIDANGNRVVPQNSSMGGSRFKPLILEPARIDPFSPTPILPASPQTFGGGSMFAPTSMAPQPMGMGMGIGYGSATPMFGSPGIGMSGIGLNATPPSNFGMPGARNYF